MPDLKSGSLGTSKPNLRLGRPLGPRGAVSSGAGRQIPVLPSPAAALPQLRAPAFRRPPRHPPDAVARGPGALGQSWRPPSRGAARSPAAASLPPPLGARGRRLRHACRRAPRAELRVPGAPRQRARRACRAPPSRGRRPGSAPSPRPRAAPAGRSGLRGAAARGLRARGGGGRRGGAAPPRSGHSRVAGPARQRVTLSGGKSRPPRQRGRGPGCARSARAGSGERPRGVRGGAGEEPGPGRGCCAKSAGAAGTDTRSAARRGLCGFRGPPGRPRRAAGAAERGSVELGAGGRPGPGRKAGSMRRGRGKRARCERAGMGTPGRRGGADSRSPWRPRAARSLGSRDSPQPWEAPAPARRGERAARLGAQVPVSVP